MSAYSDCISYLYQAAPLFQNIGAGAYKEGLATTRALDEHFGHPHRRYRTIHVAGTNGKGSVSSTLAAVLQSAGLCVGLYTSPHLVDFRERIRVNGEMIPQQRVVDFVEQERAFFEPLHPSFFELTTALAFLYFAEQKVDVAVVEVGLGGRLDCTNIVVPDLSIITNISYDHQQFLGNTLAEIAAEKAGIMKDEVPVVVGETNGHDEVRGVFMQIAAEHHCPLRFADEEEPLSSGCDGGTLSSGCDGGSLASGCDGAPFSSAGRVLSGFPAENLFQLRGDYQRANLRTVFCAIDELRHQTFYAECLTDDAISEGLSHVCDLTGLRGRWQVVDTCPMTICDVGHNAAGIEQVVAQLLRQPQRHMHIVFGMVGDKDYRRAMELMSTLRDRADFYLTQPSSDRALSAGTLAAEARRQHLHVRACVPSINKAVEAARAHAHPDDLIFIGGSCYLIADYFSLC